MRKGGQKIFVDGIALTKDALLLVHLRLEPLALQVWVDELAEGVHEFHPTGIELKALGQAGVGRFRTRQRGKVGGIVAEDGRAAVAKPRLDTFYEHAAENVGPRIVSGYPDTGVCGRRCQSPSPLRSGIESGQEIDAGEPIERFREA